MNRINKEVILKIIVLSGFALFYFNILRDNSIINYVHPRIVPFAKVSVILMILIIACLMLDLKKSLTYRKNLNVYIIFAVVFIIIFLGGKENKDDNNDLNMNLEHTYIENSSSYKDVNKDDIVINEKNFIEFLDKSAAHDNEYLNKNIEITGFIFREKDNVYIARNVMVCCSADMNTIGIKIIGEDIDNLNDETWVKVIGNIDSVDNGEAIFKVKKIVNIDKPKLPYVYPY